MDLEFSMSRFGVEGSLELLVSDIGVDGAISKTQNNFYTVIKRL